MKPFCLTAFFTLSLLCAGCAQTPTTAQKGADCPVFKDTMADVEAALPPPR
ncbi:MAG: hypothetical protein KGQ41_05305 [Alphaproteobacteria bacterium]|nr:hypothetical protein [Alphaproteobacteria bacterium]